MATVDTDLVHKIDQKTEPKWRVGARAIIPHIVWSYINSNVATSILRKNKESMKPPFFLCAFSKTHI